MAKLKQKTLEVQKFGGTEKLGDVNYDGFNHDVQSVEVQSQTKLEQDKGYGNAVTIRCFTFGMNPDTWKKAKQERGGVTKQELFNAHIRGIEVSLWKDGWKLYTDVEPRIGFDTKKMQYSIYVAARPMKGYAMPHDYQPKTLGDIVNG